MKRNLICRTCQRVMRWLLRFAPARFQEWGDAMMAETEQIERPVESLSWSLGCVGIILQQAIWNVCHGACCGAWFWITAKEEGIGVRNARMIAVSALFVALGFFLAPSFRQAMSIAFDTVDGAPWANEGSGESALAQARITAERQRDARMLAYVAVHEERIEMAQEAADQAVTIDPQWTWVYYVLACRDMAGYPRRTPAPQSALWIEKLRQWDPQNAVTYMLEAERLVHAVRLDRNGEQILGNKAWVEIMARSFDAPKYDSYFQQGFDLDRDIATQAGSGNPLRFTVGLISHPMPNLGGVFKYEKLVLSGAKDPSDLAQQAKRVIAFGERMMAADTEIEQIFGQKIALDGYQKLQPVAAPANQALIAARVTQLKGMALEKVRSYFLLRLGLVVNARIVEVCFLLIVIAAMAMISFVGISIFRRARGSRKFNLVFYGAAGIMLLACIAAFVAYLPYAHLVAQAMDPQTPVKVSLPLLLNFLSFATAVMQLLPVWPYVWSVVLAVLSLLALWLVLRQFRRPGPQLPVMSAG